MERFGLGWWTAKISFYGPEFQVEGSMRRLRDLFEARLGKALDFKTWHKGQPYEASARGVPSTVGLQSVNWFGGRGGHLSFAPVMPQDGARVLAYAKRVKEISAEQIAGLMAAAAHSVHNAQRYRTQFEKIG